MDTEGKTNQILLQLGNDGGTKFENPAPEIHHKLALWAANCAEHVLHLFEDTHPDDKRPRLAIAALREWVRGERTMVSCREAAFAAHDAARAATEPAAVAAAHMYSHTPHAGDYAAKAVKLTATKESANDAWSNERHWQCRPNQEDKYLTAFGKRIAVIRRAQNLTQEQPIPIWSRIYLVRF